MVSLRTKSGRTLLSVEQEVALAARIHGTDKDDALLARNELVEANMGLAVAYARQFRGRGLSYEDLVQESNVGLIRAADVFDPATHHGIPFASCARRWIKGFVMVALAEKTNFIRVPKDAFRLVADWRATRDRMELDCGHPPAPEEVSARMGLTALKHRNVTRLLGLGQVEREHGFACEFETGSGREMSNLGSLAAEGDRDPGDIEEDELLIGVIIAAVDRLGDRDRTIIRKRFGLDGEEAMEFAQIGRIVGLSPHRTGFVAKLAISRLRKAFGVAQ